MELALKVEYVPLESIRGYKNNAKEHTKSQIEQIAESIQHFGFNDPIGVWNNEIVEGHGRLAAAKKLNLPEVPIIRLDHLSDADRKIYILTHNKLTLNTGFDIDRLVVEVEDLKGLGLDLDLTGFTAPEIEDLFVQKNPPKEDDITEDTPPEPPKNPVTKQGDLWLLGHHRVLCGDSANPADVKRLMDGQTVQCCVTSPPYAMQRAEDYGGIVAEDYPQWFLQVAGNVWDVLHDTGSFFVNIKEHVEDGQRSLYVMQTIIEMVKKGWRYVDQLIWTKPGLPGSWNNRLRNDFEPVHFFTKHDSIDWMVQLVEIENLEGVELGFVSAHEDIFHFSKTQKITFQPKRVGKVSDRIRVYDPSKPSKGASGNISLGGNYKTGIARPGNVLHIAGNNELILHSAVFPVKLPAFFIKLTTATTDLVYEPFGGSGTTLIAAEQLDRRCFVMERSERYVDLIINRWETFTGNKAVRT